MEEYALITLKDVVALRRKRWRMYQYSEIVHIVMRIVEALMEAARAGLYTVDLKLEDVGLIFDEERRIQYKIGGFSGFRLEGSKIRLRPGRRPRFLHEQLRAQVFD